MTQTQMSARSTGGKPINLMQLQTEIEARA